MDRGAFLLQTLREDIRRRLDVVRRSVGAASVDIEPASGGEFAVKVTWRSPEGEKCFSKNFTRALVFGTSGDNNPLSLRILKPGCMHTKDLIREVLQARGVL